MNGKQTESKGAGGAWAWVRRNDAILLVGGLVIAMMQYQTIQMAALVEVSVRLWGYWVFTVGVCVSSSTA